jgi:hypothetical protein
MPVPSVPSETVNVVNEICGLIMSKLLELINPAEVSIPAQDLQEFIKFTKILNLCGLQPAAAQPAASIEVFPPKSASFLRCEENRESLLVLQRNQLKLFPNLFPSSFCR